jgi:pyruvate formate lyase activating enzyme
VRANDAGRMVLTTYGRSTGFCLDPIEKKPLNHFYPGTAVLSFGTAGCNLACKYCQNWSISAAKALDATIGDEGTPETIVAAAKATGAAGIAFTYNDPIIFAEYAIDCARAAHEVGLYTVAVTNGYIEPEAYAPFFSVMDAANVDLKAFTEHFYQRYCGGHIEPVKETLKYLVHHTTVWVEVTTLIIATTKSACSPVGSATHWRPTFRSTSPRFTPISNCATFPPPRRKRSNAPGRLPGRKDCGMSIPGTSGIARAVRPSVPGAARH